MKMIIQRLLAISAVIVLSIVLNYATTQDIINAEAAQIGFQVLLLIYLIQLVVFLISFALKTEHYYDLTGGITYISVIVYTLYQKQLLGTLDFRSILLGVLILVWAMRLSSFLFLRIKKAGKDRRFDKIKTNFTRFMLAWALQVCAIGFDFLMLLGVIKKKHCLCLPIITKPVSQFRCTMFKKSKMLLNFNKACKLCDN